MDTLEVSENLAEGGDRHIICLHVVIMLLFQLSYPIYYILCDLVFPIYAHDLFKVLKAMVAKHVKFLAYQEPEQVQPGRHIQIHV